MSESSDRSLVLVVGSGRSGTSTFSGILKRLGFHVPSPEVTPDVSNPKGFSESKWVVDFHARLLKSAKVQPSDARPDAWSAAGEVATAPVAAELSAFMRKQFAQSDHVLIKDPRLMWFLPLWRRVAIDLGVTPRYVTMLRHPAAVIVSKNRHYGNWQGDVSRTAGWVNTQLYTERATRDEMRAFVRYEDLLDDWTKVIASVGDTLQLSAISKAPSGSIRFAEGFIDRSLARTPADWSQVAVPEALQSQADHVWSLLQDVADKDATSSPDIEARFDIAREDYVTYYRVCEAVAESTVVAAIKGNQRKSSTSLEKLMVRMVPDRYRRKVPVRYRRAILSALGQRGRG